MVKLSEAVKRAAGVTTAFMEREVSEDVARVLEKMLQGQRPSQVERAILINPVEAGAILSINSGRIVSRNYLKQMVRIRPKADGTPMKRRLMPAKSAGGSNLYYLGDVYDVGPIREAGSRERKKTEDDTEGDGGRSPSVRFTHSGGYVLPDLAPAV